MFWPKNPIRGKEINRFVIIFYALIPFMMYDETKLNE